MGQEILYCSKCQTRMTGADFEKGQAFRIADEAVCLNCAREIMASLSPKEKEAILAASARSSRKIPAFHPAAAEPAAKSKSTVRRLPPAKPRGKPLVPWILVSLGIAAVLALLVWALHRPAPRDDADFPMPPPPPPPPSVRINPPPPTPPPPSPAPDREESARAALKRAKDFAAAHPSDFAGQVEQFRKALWDAEKSPLQPEVERELNAALSRERSSLEAELAALDAQVRDAVGKSEFGKALEILESSLARRSTPGWKDALDRKKKEVEAAREAAEGKALAPAQDALRRRAWGEVKRIRAETARKGDARSIEALDRALAEASASIGLVAWWPFDESEGTAASDASGRGHEGRVRGKADWRPSGGRSGGAIAFDGSSTYVVVENRDDLNMTGALTLAAWCRADDWNTNRRILQKGSTDNQYRLTIDQKKYDSEDRVFRFDLKNAGTLDLDLPAAGEWLHVAATFDGNTMKVYFNGTLAGDKPASGRIAVTGNPLIIGNKREGAPPGDLFSGLLDEVRIYDRALTAEEVAALARPPE